MSGNMNLYPIIIVEDRYNGVYSGGKWIAVADYRTLEDSYSRLEIIEEFANGGDGDSDAFWHNPNQPIGIYRLEKDYNID